mmetsp:Transcript_12479/g.25183  ORF Transcript_12479/g.25183 Transcript_12479/m.25183 type:complete len:276 (-) Transcript_12479:73-900(-)
MQYEHGNSGRVPLRDFYGAALNGSWQFSESKGYLRDIGALDEADPERPSVIIPNYVLSPSNCVAGTQFYSVCCINECGPILGHIEHQVAAPESSPSELVALVEQMSSSTVVAPRKLPAVMVRQLEAIAAEHGGRVPLHGRLFAQWLHHAFPRECPLPHLAWAVAPLEAKQRASVSGPPLLASAEEMREVASQAPWGPDKAEGEEAGLACSWHPEEELFIPLPARPAEQRRGGSALRGAALLGGVCSMALGLLRTAMGVARSAGGSTAKGMVVLPM